jgi:hypothetical protein
MGNFTHSNTVATGWRRTSVPSGWPRVESTLPPTKFLVEIRVRYVPFVRTSVRPSVPFGHQPDCFILSGETLARCPRKEPPWNRRFLLAGYSFLSQRLPMYGQSNCVMVSKDAVGII